MLGMLNTYETQNTDPQTPELATESLGSPVAHHGRDADGNKSLRDM